ncbi:hypothetical protein EG329_002919 [Neofusicoccum parvum]|nr:hypothetical protein EG329_002919 [Neofusicoccum parvum]
MVSTYEKAFEGAIKGQKQGFIRQLATLSERIFVMVITLATRQHEPKTNSYLKRKLKMAPARADELRSILADPDLEPDDRRDAASRLADVGVELLATAFARGDEYRPLVGSFARLWACAVGDAAGGGSGGGGGGGGQPIRKKDVADVIEAFFMKFRDALRAGDGKRVELIAEAGVEILIEIAISGNEVLLEMMADNLARMMREAVERNMEDLLAKVLQRRREALEGQLGDPRLDATMREDLIRIFTL